MAFTLDICKGWTEEQMKRRIRELVRANIGKDILICSMVEFGSLEAMPRVQADAVREIVTRYCHNED